MSRYATRHGSGQRKLTTKWFLLLTLLSSCQARAIPRDARQDCMIEWLLSLQVSQEMATAYHHSFRSELLDQRSLMLMTIGQLQSLGVSALGHSLLIKGAVTSGAHDTCRNGGSCNFFTESQSYRCSCLDGFTGEICQNIANGCRENPCKNGGTCENDENDTISCACPSGYRGDLCQHSENHSLAQTVNELSYELQTLKAHSQASSLAIADTMRKSTGLRYFRPWLELDLFSTIYIRYFSIDGRHFLGTISQNNRSEEKGIVIFELLDSECLVRVQLLSKLSASSFKVFFLEGYYYMVVAHHYDPTIRLPRSENSELYKWNGTTSSFSLSTEPGASNDFKTMGISDVDFVTLSDGNSFLAFAAHDNKKFLNVSTILYRQHESRGRNFYHFKNLTTAGASRANFFTFNSITYLFVAEEQSPRLSYRTNSSIFRWNSTDFELIQEIETEAANDLLPFSIGNNFFVVAVHNREGEGEYKTQSIVYILSDGVFVFYCALDTKGAKKADFFRIGLESFLVFSNSRESNYSVTTTSVIYRVEGGKFVCFQEIPTQNAMYVHVFKMENDCTVLAIANKGSKPRLYKWRSLSYKDGNDS